MSKFHLRTTTLFMALSTLSTAAAANGECLAAPTLVQKLALYGLPILVLGAAGFVFSKMWASAAVNRGVPPSSHATAGWACGLFLSALSFSGMLYATSQQNDAEGVMLSSASCYPDGWGIIAGILTIVTLIVFVVTKVNAK